MGVAHEFRLWQPYYENASGLEDYSESRIILRKFGREKRDKSDRRDSESMVNQPQATSSATPVLNTEDQVASAFSTVNLIDSLQKQYLKIKENAETYPYVWASYIVVYGGFGLWTAYRWKKLRKTEDRVKNLQEKLRKLVETEESAISTSTKVVEKGSTSSETPSK
ncbi:hypothetical protein Ahy_A03g016210 [Arachis hypogaea]|uniref:Transmembrane protein n=1 Tax=Arachis hypogaea TaxID=3818 RepID=A0A445E2J0_ARAHY|nr:hypothetical protein Ahy_A03g016210 [Arachis hypogaea]